MPDTAAVRIRTAPRVVVRCPACHKPITSYLAPHLGEPGGPGPVYVVAGAPDPERLEDGRLRFRCPRRWPASCGRVYSLGQGVVAALVITAARAGRRHVRLDQTSVISIRATGHEILVPRVQAMIRRAAPSIGVGAGDLAVIIVRHFEECGELIDPRTLVASLRRMAASLGVPDPHRADVPTMLRELAARLADQSRRPDRVGV